MGHKQRARTLSYLFPPKGVLSKQKEVYGKPFCFPTRDKTNGTLFPPRPEQKCILRQRRPYLTQLGREFFGVFTLGSPARDPFDCASSTGSMAFSFTRPRMFERVCSRRNGFLVLGPTPWSESGEWSPRRSWANRSPAVAHQLSGFVRSPCFMWTHECPRFCLVNSRARS